MSEIPRVALKPPMSRIITNRRGNLDFDDDIDKDVTSDPFNLRAAAIGLELEDDDDDDDDDDEDCGERALAATLLVAGNSGYGNARILILMRLGGPSLRFFFFA